MIAATSGPSTRHSTWLGDFFSGYLHPELKQENALAPGDAAAFAMRFYAQSSGFKFEAPCQSFYLIHAQDGGSLALNAPVWVRDRRERSYSA